MIARMAYRLILLTAFACLGCFSVNGQEVNYKAYSLFVYNFIKYIEWPPGNSDQFVIGVAGDSPIVEELRKMAVSKKAHGKSIVVKVVNSSTEIAQCDLLYMPDAKSKLLKEYLANINNKPVLVVSEREGLAKKGAGINFVTDELGNLKFEVNKIVLSKHNLKIPTVLLNLGYAVS